MENKSFDYYENERNELAPYINSDAKKILDVGCGAGIMAASIKKKNDAEVWGIEMIEDAAAEAQQRIDKVLCGKVEDKIDELPDNYFDLIIFADVLEHLYDPYLILEKLRKKLKSDGEMVASIPNIGHWSIIKGLLAGKWEYKEWGLLDKTHIRFFTKKSSLELFENAGMVNLFLGGSVIYDETIPDSFLRASEEIGINPDTLKFDSEIFQYIVVAKNSDCLKNAGDFVEQALKYAKKNDFEIAKTLLKTASKFDTISDAERLEIEEVIKNLDYKENNK